MNSLIFLSFGLLVCLFRHLSTYGQIHIYAYMLFFLTFYIFTSVRLYQYPSLRLFTESINSLIYQIFYISMSIYLKEYLPTDRQRHKSFSLNQYLHLYVSPSVYPTIYRRLSISPHFSHSLFRSSLHSSAGSDGALPACQRR